MWFIGVEVEQETSAPPPKKNPRSAPVPDPDLEIRGARSSRPKDKGEGAVSPQMFLSLLGPRLVEK